MLDDNFVLSLKVACGFAKVMSRLELALKNNRLSKIIHLYLKEHVYFLQSTLNLQIAFICTLLSVVPGAAVLKCISVCF